jgi:hypothetical protein
MYNGVTNRDPNGFPSAAPLAGGCVLLLVVLVVLSACTDEAPLLIACVRRSPSHEHLSRLPA